MIKQTITYTDYDGVERTEDFYFGLSKTEIMEMQFSTQGGYDALLDRIIKSKDVKSLFSVFKDLVLKAYGIKSDDGKRFIKSKEISEEFVQSPAYDYLFTKFMTDTDAAAAFVKGVLPSDVSKMLADIEAGKEPSKLTLAE